LSNPIERDRYFDGEFLRALDFDAEQAYHLRLRRRLNRQLHLWGIVEGLQLQVDSQTGIAQVSILPGMAIDALGREIFLFAPYTFGDSDISGNRITADGTYDVWIRYRKTATSMPSSGYTTCNDSNQYTRWVESSSAVLLPAGTTPFTAPLFDDEDTDDPTQDQVGVKLGSVSVSMASFLNQFDKPSPTGRVYIGARTQRLRPPVDATPDAPAFAFLNQNNALTPPISLGMEANVYAQQNLVVGDDFQVLPAKIQPPPVGTYPAPTGNVKITKDLIVNGEIYCNADSAGTFMAFKERVVSFLPDIVVGYQPVTITKKPGAPPNMISDTATITLPSKLAAIRTAVPIASIAGFQFDSENNLNTLAGGSQVQLRIDSVAFTTAPNAVTVTVAYTAGPVTATFSSINNFKLSVMVICFP
jgi:hypothetical protein